MTNKELAMQYAKEITIAKMSNAAPGQTSGESGRFIGDMYEAIYNKIYEIASNNPSESIFF